MDRTGIVFIEPLLKRIIANKVKIKPYILIAIGDYKNIINDIPVYYIGYKMLTLLKGKTLVSNNSDKEFLKILSKDLKTGYIFSIPL